MVDLNTHYRYMPVVLFYYLCMQYGFRIYEFYAIAPTIYKC